jgi:molybdate transport system substrate-binding protein
VPFARNRLVLAVPVGSSARGLRDLERPGRRLAIGSATVPIGSYTAQILARLDPSERALVLHNVRSREPDVTGILGKLTQGAVDGGFVYVTDVFATRGALRAIELPAALQPTVVYEAAVVRGGNHGPQARAFIDGLLHGRGAARLRAAGFGPPPA